MRQNIQDKLDEIIALAELEGNAAVQSICLTLKGAMTIYDEQWMAAKVRDITLELRERAIAGKEQAKAQQN